MNVYACLQQTLSPHDSLVYLTARNLLLTVTFQPAQTSAIKTKACWFRVAAEV